MYAIILNLELNTQIWDSVKLSPYPQKQFYKSFLYPQIRETVEETNPSKYSLQICHAKKKLTNHPLTQTQQT